MRNNILVNSDPTPSTPRKIENVGEEFMVWAEKGWAFERILSKGLGDAGSESCPYPCYREYMVNKINELVHEFLLQNTSIDIESEKNINTNSHELEI